MLLPGPQLSQEPLQFVWGNNYAFFPADSENCYDGNLHHILRNHWLKKLYHVKGTKMEPVTMKMLFNLSPLCYREEPSRFIFLFFCMENIQSNVLI